MPEGSPISPRSPGRPADRQNQIVREVRDQIVKGQLPPGSRLPSQSEFGRIYGAGTHTIQRALDNLKSSGFIQSNERGTHVSLEPPHLTRYAVVIPGELDEPNMWVRFWSAIDQEALYLRETENLKLSVYHGVYSDRQKPGYQELLSDVLGHTVAGIIFITYPHHLARTPLITEPAMPRVGIMSPMPTRPMPTLHPDMDGFYDRAIQLLRDQGRKRIAFLSSPNSLSTTEILHYKAAAAGMESRSCWNMLGHIEVPHSARDLVQLLLQAPRSMWPDGLIIGDDNLTEAATAGLLAAGARVPEDILVVSHCNYSCLPPNRTPVVYLGFDAREMLRTAIALVDAQRQYRTVPDELLIPARFKSELVSAEELVYCAN